jgi:hypothetical protein
MIRTRADLRYVSKVELDKECWVYALQELDRIQNDPDIFDPRLCIGEVRWEDAPVMNCHAWIKYIKRTESGWVAVTYDPTSDRYAISHMIDWTKPKERDFDRPIYNNWTP